MKVLRHSLWALVILLWCSVSSAQSLKIATGEWAPITSRKMEGYGEFTRLATIVFKEMGIEPDYCFYPWRRCFDSVEKNRVWAGFPYSYTRERSEKVWFSDPLSCSTTRLSAILKMHFSPFMISSVLAEKLGATASFSPADTKMPPKIRELTGGRGVDVTIEAVGIEATLKDCLASTRHGGTVIVQGIFTERTLVHMLGFVTREITMIGANSINPERALELLTTKQIAPESIVTSITSLSTIVEGGFEMLANHKDEEIKILVEP